MNKNVKPWIRIRNRGFEAWTVNTEQLRAAFQSCKIIVGKRKTTLHILLMCDKLNSLHFKLMLLTSRDAWKYIKPIKKFSLLKKFSLVVAKKKLTVRYENILKQFKFFLYWSNLVWLLQRKTTCYFILILKKYKLAFV